MKQNLYNNEDVFNYSKVDTSNEDSLLNELITEIPTDEMEKTLELDTLPLDNDEKAFLEPKPKIEAKKDVIIKNIKMLYEVIGEKEPSIHPQWGSPHLFPWAYLPEEGVSKIIIGTIPPKKYCHGLCDEYYDNENTFFYESNHNSLWTYLKTKEEKRSYIKEHKIGFIDLIKQCTRKNNSSLDKDLIVDQDDIVNIDELVKVLKYAEEINVKNDIKEIKLCCTSHSFKSAHYFLKQIVKMKLQLNNSYLNNLPIFYYV